MLKGYKTLIVNGIIAVFGVLSAVFGPDVDAPTADQVGILVDTADGLIMAIVGLINVGLRMVTTTPVFWKSDDA